MRVKPTRSEREASIEAMKRQRQRSTNRGPVPEREERPIDPNALPRIEGLEAAAALAAEHGLEIRVYRLAGRANKLDSWYCEFWRTFRDLQLGKWYASNCLLVIGGCRLWPENVVDALHEVLQRCKVPKG